MYYACFAAVFCFGIEQFFGTLFKDRRKGNSVACVSFQSWLLFRSFREVFAVGMYGKSSRLCDLENSLSALMGYFLYDFLYLIRRQDWKFMLHHLIGMYMIVESLKNQFTPKIVLAYHIFIIVSECMNPISNLKHLTRNHPRLYRWNTALHFYCFTLFRMILFPLVSYIGVDYIPKKQLQKYYVVNSSLYLMSSFWYIKLWHLYKKVVE